jgi:hypothetical protein
MLVVFTGFSMLYLKEPMTWNVGISHSAITALPAIMDVYRSMLVAVRSEAGRFSTDWKASFYCFFKSAARFEDVPSPRLPDAEACGRREARTVVEEE